MRTPQRQARTTVAGKALFQIPRLAGLLPNGRAQSKGTLCDQGRLELVCAAAELDGGVIHQLPNLPSGSAGPVGRRFASNVN